MTGGCANAIIGIANGVPAAELHAGRREHLGQPYPRGESWRQAVARIGRFLTDMPLRWNGQRFLIVGHVATRWGLDHFISGLPLGLAEQNFACQEGMGVPDQVAKADIGQPNALRRLTGQRSRPRARSCRIQRWKSSCMASTPCCAPYAFM
jgi:hypothetical protein